VQVASHGIAIKEADSAANPQNFIVFDGFCEQGEGSSPTVYFSRCPPNADQHFAVLQVGILLPLRNFCTHFSPGSTFDSIATDTHETAVLELQRNIFMAVQRHISSSPNHNLLLSILQSFSSIYRLFFCEYNGDPSGSGAVMVSVCARLVFVLADAMCSQLCPFCFGYLSSGSSFGISLWAILSRSMSVGSIVSVI
jgi:hypothetical protein